MSIEVEYCAHCRASIPPNQLPYILHDEVVCQSCFRRAKEDSITLPPKREQEPATSAAHRTVATPTAPSMSGLKLFLIVTAGVACGLTLALICYSVFFAAAGATIVKTQLSANSDLGPDEKYFINSIGSSDPEGVRDYLVKPLNWQQVATPALKEIVRGGKFEVSPYESDEEKGKRQFWIDLSERLIKNGADVNAALHNSYDIDALRFLITHKANVNFPDATGDTVLHQFARDDYSDDKVAFLISSGANVNAVGREGDAPLHRAARGGALKVIDRLLNAGASINAKNKAGQTPLAIANLAMQKDSAALLKSRGGTE